MSLSSNARILHSSIFRTVLILFSLLLYVEVKAQEREIVASVRYGRSSVHGMKSPIGEFGALYRQAGVSCSYEPIKAPFSLRSGLSYARRSQSEGATDLILIPSEIEFGFGNRVQWLIGIELISGLILDQGQVGSSVMLNKNRFRFGAGMNSGIGIEIGEMHSLDIKYHLIINTIHAHETERFSPGRAQFTVQHYWHDSFISLSVSRSLPKSK